MDLQKINVKFFLEDGAAVPWDEFLPVFHSWIQSSDGDYVDVADYSHVPSGPGIVLVAYGANISLDANGNRPGLLYNRKQPLEGTNGEKLRTVFRLTLECCRRLEKEPALRGKVRFLGREALFLVNDRLLAPNTEETFRSLRPDLEELARSLYGGSEFTLQPGTDPQQRFSVNLAAPAAVEISTLLKNLAPA